MAASASFPLPAKFRFQQPHSWPPSHTDPIPNTLLSPSLYEAQEVNGQDDMPNLHQEWPTLLRTCNGFKDLKRAKALHGFLLKSTSPNSIFESNNLINMYSKCSCLDSALQVFAVMPTKNPISWTSIISGCVQNEEFSAAVSMFKEANQRGEKINEHAYTVLLQACAILGLGLGRQLHGLTEKFGFSTNPFVGTSLVAMYSRERYIGDAQKAFEGIAERDARCWNAMIAAYAQNGYEEEAIRAFCDLMQSSGLGFNEYSIGNTISACSGSRGSCEGKQLHALAIKSGSFSHMCVGNVTISMYVKLGLLRDAEMVFNGMREKNLVSWTALMSGYAQNGDREKALGGFLEMHALDVGFDSSSLTTLLEACCGSGCGVQVHALAIKIGYVSDVYVSTALIDMYSKCGKTDSAFLIFNGLSKWNVVSFNAVVADCARKESHQEEALVLFNDLRFTDVEPDSVSLSCLMSICANQASIAQGKSFHGCIIKSGLDSEIMVGNSTINMYAKCGSIKDAQRVFEGMERKDLITWNSMISGYALHGQGKEALQSFEELERERIRPDEVTLLVVLQACSHSGLYKDGLHLFKTMAERFEIKPLIEHHASMVDIMGRSGLLPDALSFIERSQFSRFPLLWRTLLSACSIHGDVNLGKIAAEKLLELGPDDSASYILVSNMFSSKRMWGESAQVRTAMNDRKMRKEMGCSWIEVENKVHRFHASGREHPESREIYEKLERLSDVIREKGYGPATDVPVG
ncbi:pentatricopeptide repeat-containing protein At3g02330 [Amborella trichopoda]|uniref:pentatricopeptide repeat-containing protein At3g02330 n=1 Tax=Amborella trichopoda TaxID=13333 RepID=UPI0005D3F30A|nr:pentatricopeptide repeat-containing protein At3g02330 [Amborella trichopoda]|eukprot:XP_011621447.1 pentatricopeptide repeat-containing protein At3g02330 [Amborella trichopoda]